MSATTISQSSHLSNQQSSQSLSQSNGQPSAHFNNHHGDNNQDNRGYIGHGSRNMVFSGDNNRFKFINPATNQEDENDELDALLPCPKVSSDALHTTFGSPTECYPDTRKISCSAIVQWASDSTGSPLLWLHGPAGVGKSVIAKTMSNKNQIQVVATFFFSTSSDKSAVTLFPTLAWQLGKNVPETKQYIVAALKGNRYLLESEFEQQFYQLIIHPLRKCTSTVTSNLVMVIDGVDECIDEKRQSRFLKILKDAGEKEILPLRFLICSRPEPRIRAILETNDDDAPLAKSTPKSTPKSTTKSTSSDIPTPLRLYANPDQSEIAIDSAPKKRLLSLVYQIWIRYLLVAKDRLNASLRWRPKRSTMLPSDAWKLWQPTIGEDKGYSNSHSEIGDKHDEICHRKVISRIRIGLSDESKDDIRLYLSEKFKKNSSIDAITPKEIDELVERSCGQFLYASIIVRLLDEKCLSPQTVLRMAQSSSLPSPDLDRLYSAILDHVMRLEDGIDKATDLVILKDVLAILIVLWTNVQLANIPKSFPIIDYLSDLEKGELERILRKMHSVLEIVPERSIRVYHRSFFEFLLQKGRSGNHCIAYSFALRRFLYLVNVFVLRYFFRRYSGLLR